MNKSQLSGTNETQENSEQGNPGIWSRWGQLPRVSLEWQVELGVEAGHGLGSTFLGLSTENSMNQEQAQSRGAPYGSGAAPD